MKIFHQIPILYFLGPMMKRYAWNSHTIVGQFFIANED